MVVFTFSVLDRKYCYWTNLVQKIKSIAKIKRERLFFYIPGFIFHVVSYAKTDLHHKIYDLTLFGSFFEQGHLLNLIILGKIIYVKR